MASIIFSSSRGSSSTSDASPGSLMDESDNCCPLSSSTIFSSSPPLYTPPAMDRCSQGEQTLTCLQGEGAALKPIVTDIAGTTSHCRSDPATYPDEDNSKSGNWSSSCNDETTSETVARKHPRYYSLQSRSAQIEFGKHLESLLLAVLDERRDSAGTPSAACETPSAQSCSSVSPLPVSSPNALVPRFIYVNVDEYTERSELSGDSSSSEDSYQSSTSSQSQSQQPANTDVCHPSKSLPSSLRTPLPATSICVPSAPKKIQYHIYASDSSPLDVERLAKHPSDGDARDITPDVDYMRVDRPTQFTGDNKTVHTCDTPPQADDAICDGPEKKKQKLSRSNSSTSRELQRKAPASRLLVAELASLRRAASLRSEASAANILHESTNSDISTTATTDQAATLDCALGLTILRNSDVISARPLPAIPEDREITAQTEPCSPLPRTDDNNPSRTLLPLAAPPPFEQIPRAPLTAIETAEARIANLVHKDWEERLTDGLSVLATPVETEFGQNGKTKVKQEEGEIRLSRSLSQEDEEDIASKLGIRESLRLKVVQWMLDVMPPTAIRSKPKFCSHLRRQLLESHDTRWHAAHLFTRYFLRLGTSPSDSPQIHDESGRRCVTDDDEDNDTEGKRLLTGKEALTWDLAVACMALAVKFHRDVLPPLYPVTAEEFLVLSPHTMDYDDLESAQRVLLSALSFCVGSNTPGAYMDEIWEALPSLRALVEKRGNWQVTKIETWELLSDTLLDAAYLNYPVHVLTGCALILGTVESLVLTMKAEAAESLKLHALGRAARTKRREAECTCAKLQKKARKAVKYVEQDLRELLNAPEELWNNCMHWLETIAEI